MWDALTGRQAADPHASLLDPLRFYPVDGLNEVSRSILRELRLLEGLSTLVRLGRHLADSASVGLLSGESYRCKVRLHGA